MLQRDVVEGIHRVEDAHVNWYLVEDGHALLVVDAGVPRSWRSLGPALAALDRDLSAVVALVLTHAHFDHVGFAERLRAARGIPVWVHENDVPLTRRPLRYAHERSRIAYPLRHRAARPLLADLVRAGALCARPIARVRRYGDGDGRHRLPVPGTPRTVFTPGHTLGHAALHFPERDAVISGDALVTLDPYTGARGPRLVARAATADSERALRSLDALVQTGARHVLPGHGEPWHDGVAAAVERARAAGVR